VATVAKTETWTLSASETATCGPCGCEGGHCPPVTNPVEGKSGQRASVVEHYVLAPSHNRKHWNHADEVWVTASERRYVLGWSAGSDRMGRGSESQNDLFLSV
jgi:hypothetical protein